MKASEARKLSESKNDELQQILIKIKEAATMGEVVIYEEFTEETREMLENLGYFTEGRAIGW